VSINLDEKKIQEIAYDFAQQPKNYDDYIWLLAENELRLLGAYPDSINPLSGSFPEKVVLYPNKIVDFPPTEQVKQLAELYAAQAPSLQDLHWFIAERVYIYNNAKYNR
jgi:hypothetical protein